MINKVKLISIIIFIFIIFSSIFISTIMLGSALEKQNEANIDKLMLSLPEILTKEMVLTAVKNEEKYGIPASLTLSQIIQESSGKYPGGLSGLAYYHKNLFGLKGKGTAGTTIQKTEEYSSGEAYQTQAGFRKYYNFKESIIDHGELLITPRYKSYTSKITTTDTVEKANLFAKAITSAGYATDPSYADKLIQHMNNYDLYMFDGLDENTAENFLNGDGEYSGKLAWPLNSYGTITSVFGNRDKPIAGATTSHNAIDISMPTGSTIKAADGGEVIHADWYGTGGKAVIIKHDMGTETHYYHMSQITVRKGQKVTKGQSIGKVGSTGASTGPHLHFGFKLKGYWVDPLKYVKYGVN